MTRSRPISWRLGVSSFNISWIPARLISSAAWRTSLSLPSRPNREVISFSQYLSSRSNVGLWAQVEILINSAKPFRTWPSGKVFKKEKSRNVCIGAWYAPRRFL